MKMSFFPFCFECINLLVFIFFGRNKVLLSFNDDVLLLYMLSTPQNCAPFSFSFIRSCNVICNGVMMRFCDCCKRRQRKREGSHNFVQLLLENLLRNSDVHMCFLLLLFFP